MGQGNKKGVKVDFPNKGKRNVVGGAGPIGFISGAAGKAAKGAIALIKSVFKNKNISNLAKGKKRTTTPKSKPVDYMGPNPMHKTGAAGNSYPG